MGESKDTNKMRWKGLLLLWLIATVGVVAGVWYFKPNRYVAEFPYILENHAKTATELSCDSLVSSGLRADKDFLNKQDGVKGEVLKGTDKIAIKIEEQELKFLTRASFDVGTTEGRPFLITKNDDEGLMAIDTEDDAVNTFILEKSTGLAIWTKDRLKPFVAGHPDTQSFYLICR